MRVGWWGKEGEGRKEGKGEGKGGEERTMARRKVKGVVARRANRVQFPSRRDSLTS